MGREVSGRDHLFVVGVTKVDDRQEKAESGHDKHKIHSIAKRRHRNYHHQLAKRSAIPVMVRTEAGCTLRHQQQAFPSSLQVEQAGPLVGNSTKYHFMWISPSRAQDEYPLP
ncbi:hypothetical protein HAX54_037770 [Datura stramonium]|uniref:Uncharacterized protein n=1 Tax=Datura stramonium TaxID=4076 RepID=A0ABS8RMM8_DATST|nr:hypothetical protein [Datura stramonium]